MYAITAEMLHAACLASRVCCRYTDYSELIYRQHPLAVYSCRVEHLSLSGNGELLMQKLCLRCVPMEQKRHDVVLCTLLTTLSAPATAADLRAFIMHDATSIRGMEQT